MLNVGRWTFREAVDHFLARTFLRVLRPGMEQIDSLLEKAPAFPQIRRRFRLENELNLLGEILDTVQLQRHRHSPARSHRVDCHWKLRRPAVDRRFLEKERLPALGRFHLTVRPFAEYEIGLDRDRNARQFAGLIKCLDELAEGRVSHRAKMAFPRMNNKSTAVPPWKFLSRAFSALILETILSWGVAPGSY